MTTMMQTHTLRF